MEKAESPTARPSTWEWDRGITHCTVEYAAGGTGEVGELTWIEEISPDDDERGYGSHTTSTQTPPAFLAQGPHSGPPVPVVEAMLAHFETPTTPWLDPYRLLDATSRQDIATVRALLARGVPPDQPVHKLTPIFEAIQLRNLPLAELLVDAGVNVNRNVPGGNETILMTLASWAPDATWEPLAARLIAQGPDLEARNQWGVTALMLAAGAAGRIPGLVPLLLTAGADINARSVHGYTALMQSVMSRYLPVATVELLLAKGAEVNPVDTNGWSALMWAISNTLPASVKVLLDAGADVHTVSVPTQQRRDPKSVLQLAEDYADPQVVALIRAALTSSGKGTP